MENNKLVDIIIPSFNGKYLLEKHLPQVIDNTDYLNKIIIIDNGSTDDTVSWLGKEYPEIVIIKNRVNLGFTIPITQGVAVSDSKYIVLLNNDVHPKKSYIKSALRYFDDEKVFAVSFNEHESSWPNVSWLDKIQFIKGEDKSKPMLSAWASGGSAVFRRSIWNKLGGFNQIYAPYYWEDIDIGYRSWKSGYKIIWDNQAIVYHEHESTSKKINQSYVNLIKQRNELIFNWINITDRKLVSQYRKYVMVHTLKHLGYLKVVLAALLKISTNKLKTHFVKSDREVLNSINKVYE